jgi:hypothetical protein
MKIIEEMYGGIPPLGTQISWTTVAKRLGTRNYTQCQTKWYRMNPHLEKDASSWSEDDNKILILKYFSSFKDVDSDHKILLTSSSIMLMCLSFFVFF